MPAAASLHRRRVLVTRAAHQASKLSTLLRQRGALPVECPTIAIGPTELDSTQAAALAGLCRGEYDYVVFQSSNAVAFTCSKLDTLGLQAFPQPATKIYAVGNATAAELQSRGIAPVHTPRQATGAALLAEMLAREGARLDTAAVLLPRARQGRNEVPNGLRAHGANVSEIAVYETQLRTTGPPLPSHLDWLSFTSPSAVAGFLARFGRVEGPRVACIGPTTAAKARELGFAVHVVPQRHTLEGLVDAMEAAASQGGGAAPPKDSPS